MSEPDSRAPRGVSDNAVVRRKVAIGGLGFLIGVAVIALVAYVLIDPGGSGSGGPDDGGSSGGRKPGGVAADEPAPEASAIPKVALAGLDLSAANRRAAVEGLPDWSKAGYREGKPLPTDAQVNSACRIGAGALAKDFGVRPDDGRDDSAGLQKAIDQVKKDCSPKASYDRLSLIELPKGVLDVSRQLAVDADYLIIRGAGPDPKTGTRLVFRPDENTRYDAVKKGDWDEDGMEHGEGKGGWLWPGRGLFRVQSREVDKDYREDYESAPANRRDLFEGSVNFHWKSGLEVADAGGGFAARAGDTTVPLKEDWAAKKLKVGSYVNVRAANSQKFYRQQSALPTKHQLENLHMRQQIFKVTAISGSKVTLDKPLEFDLPVDSASDGSEQIDNKTYESKLSPVNDPVVGVGIEKLAFTQAVEGGKAAEAKHNYGNMAPADQMQGIVLKWVADCWVRDTSSFMIGSHPLVTEEAKNIQVQDNYFDGSWNKGKGGNGYLRGSRVWDSLYARNITRNLRHFTFQWSASGNVVIGNDLDSDLNLHGGWERRNLFELNKVRVPFEHAPANCRSNCGGEGGDSGDTDKSAWFPIYWAAGQKAVKWSGSSGPQNVFFNNTLSKQTTKGGRFEPYYSKGGQIYQFGWNGTAFQHLQKGSPIKDWAGNEQTDFSGHGVDVSKTDPGKSLFLKNVG